MFERIHIAVTAITAVVGGLLFGFVFGSGLVHIAEALVR